MPDPIWGTDRLIALPPSSSALFFGVPVCLSISAFSHFTKVTSVCVGNAGFVKLLSFPLLVSGCG